MFDLHLQVLDPRNNAILVTILDHILVVYGSIRPTLEAFSIEYMLNIPIKEQFLLVMHTPVYITSYNLKYNMTLTQ